MPLNKDNIDALIDRHFEGSTGGGELQQLAILFSDALWSDFEKMLKRHFIVSRTGFQQEVSISLGYIDKIPLAEFDPPIRDHHGNAITEKTELGDAAFFFIDKLQRPDGKLFVRQARALILQAKQAASSGLPKVVPIVPLPDNPDESTLKELALLSDWPTFNLYFASRSKDPAQKGYEVCDENAQVQPHAWYIGASPETSIPWSPRWIAGPSAVGAACSTSLGELLCAVLEGHGKINGKECVGKRFEFDESRLSAGNFRLAVTASPPDWSDLCHQIMMVCDAYSLPGRLFAGAKRARRRQSTFYSFPINLLGAALLSIWNRVRSRLVGSKPGKGFRVVVVERISHEG